VNNASVVEVKVVGHIQPVQRTVKAEPLVLTGPLPMAKASTISGLAGAAVGADLIGLAAGLER
jgi:hypothetical protein